MKQRYNGTVHNDTIERYRSMTNTSAVIEDENLLSAEFILYFEFAQIIVNSILILSKAVVEVEKASQHNVIVIVYTSINNVLGSLTNIAIQYLPSLYSSLPCDFLIHLKLWFHINIFISVSINSINDAKLIVQPHKHRNLFTKFSCLLNIAVSIGISFVIIIISATVGFDYHGYQQPTMRCNNYLLQLYKVQNSMSSIASLFGLGGPIVIIITTLLIACLKKTIRSFLQVPSFRINEAEEKLRKNIFIFNLMHKCLIFSIWFFQFVWKQVLSSSQISGNSTVFVNWIFDFFNFSSILFLVLMFRELCHGWVASAVDTQECQPQA